MHRYSDFLENSEIAETHHISKGKEAVTQVLKAYEILLPLEREVLRLSGDSDDEGTNSLMSDYISEQEKLVWMYGAYLDE